MNNNDCAIKIVWETDDEKHMSDVWYNYCEYAKNNIRSITLAEMLRSTDAAVINSRFKRRVMEDLAAQGARMIDGYLVFENRELMTEFVLKYS